jgi:HK97 family phage prohead protease
MGLRLAPGEKWETHSPNRPNTALDPFMRYMLREVAAGTGVSYESLSRDYSQSNYSSSRLALLDDRDLWKMLQQWFIRNFREPLHREWLQAAVLAGAMPGIALAEYALDRAKFEAARFKPRGWSWVDPTKEVAAPRKPSRRASPRAPTSSPRPATGATSRTSTASACASSRTSRPQGPRVRHLASVYIAAETGSQKGTGAPPPPEGASAEGECCCRRQASAPKNKSTQERPAKRAVSFQSREVSMKPKHSIDEIRAKPDWLEGRFDRASAKKEDRTVQMSFSSELPVERWYGMEILSHDASAVDLERLSSGRANLLVNHDPGDWVGVIESARVDGKDKVGRATVRFGSGQRATEVFNDVRDGILSSVSVGYRREEMKLTRSSEEDGDEYTVTRWMPFEVSLVTSPPTRPSAWGAQQIQFPINPRQAAAQRSSHDP